MKAELVFARLRLERLETAHAGVRAVFFHKNRPVLKAESPLIVDFALKPLLDLLACIWTAEVAHHIRIGPELRGEIDVRVAPAPEEEARRLRKRIHEDMIRSPCRHGLRTVFRPWRCGERWPERLRLCRERYR